MINCELGQELLEALFNINLYGEEDKAQRMINPEDGIEYTPYPVIAETKVSEQASYSGIIKTSFDLTKRSPYYEYLEFDHATKENKGGTEVYVTDKYFTLKAIEPNHVDFSYTHYIGLFTEMPSAERASGVEPTASDYKRINLHKGIISDEISIGKAYVDTETGGSAVSNHEIMVFPESNTPEGWGTIVGFGIFNTQSGEEPIFWGRLKQPVVVRQAQVPLFRIGDFKIVLA